MAIYSTVSLLWLTFLQHGLAFHQNFWCSIVSLSEWFVGAVSHFRPKEVGQEFDYRPLCWNLLDLDVNWVCHPTRKGFDWVCQLPGSSNLPLLSRFEAADFDWGRQWQCLWHTHTMFENLANLWRSVLTVETLSPDRSPQWKKGSVNEQEVYVIETSEEAQLKREPVTWTAISSSNFYCLGHNSKDISSNLVCFLHPLCLNIRHHTSSSQLPGFHEVNPLCHCSCCTRSIHHQVDWKYDERNQYSIGADSYCTFR